MTKQLNETERAELRRLAEALPGSWYDAADLRAMDIGHENTRFIAACSPDVVLGLLALVEGLENGQRDLNECLNEAQCDEDALRARVAKLEAERDMLRSECRRLACGDFFVTDDGRTVSCGMPDGHGGPCFQYKCSEEA